MPRKIKEKIHFIYKTTNVVNGKYYIGMHTTTNVNDDYLGSGKRLRYSINKYGRENHIREILEYCKTREELAQREKEIVTLDEIAKEECMNLMIGGRGGDNRSLTTESRSKGGLNKKYRLDTDLEFKKICDKISSDIFKKAHKEGKIKYDNFKNKKHTEETKLLMSRSLKSKGLKETNSQYGTCWITNEIENKKINKNDLIPDGWKLGRVLKYIDVAKLVKAQLL